MSGMDRKTLDVSGEMVSGPDISLWEVVFGVGLRGMGWFRMNLDVLFD